MFESISKSLNHWLQETLGTGPETTASLRTLLLLLLALLVAYLIWLFSTWILSRLVPKLTEKTKALWDDIIFNKRVLRSSAMLLPVLLIDFYAPVIFADLEWATSFITGTTNILIIFILAWIVSSFFNSVNEILISNSDYKDKPIGSITQLGKILIYSIAFILALSIIFGKSPIYLLSGFGAVAAVALLVFKDSILGFVASVQLSANNMVHVGDWVTVPKFNADGDVLEINLTTIKVQNFDKTITTIPTYAFVSDSFTNWRGMEQSPGRRIKRALHIKISSIQFCSDEMIERFKKIHLVKDYIAEMQAQIDAYNKEHGFEGSVVINGRKLTNIGIFKVYLENYLRANPKINHEMTIMVRQLSSTPEGLPVEIYAFSKIKEWKAYEGVIADIFDHMFASAKFFDLTIFENPSGEDIRRLIE